MSANTFADLQQTQFDKIGLEKELARHCSGQFKHSASGQEWMTLTYFRQYVELT